MSSCVWMVSLCFVFLYVKPIDTSAKPEINEFFQGSRHTNNWAVLVCASRYWFNYRHIANALSVYRSVKRLGIPDSHIILMLADDMACNPRNPRPAKVYNNKNEAIDVYGSDVEVDYRGYEVTVENFIRVLTGRLPLDSPRSKRLNTDERSNVLVYMTGHGGEDFLKFQDAEELSNVELADAFEQMWQKRRYNELLFIIDTCQAVSMYKKFYSPNLIGIGSSQVGEDSLSHHVDPAIGVYIIDRYTYYLLEYLESIQPNSKKTIDDLFGVCPQRKCISTPGQSWTTLSRVPKNILITDFFGSVRSVYANNYTVTLEEKITSTTAKSSKTQQVAYKPFEQFPATFTNYIKKKERPSFLVNCSLIGVLLLIFYATVSSFF